MDSDRAVTGATVWPPMMSTTVTHTVLCPDLLRIEQLGVADGWRGRLVRGFFRALRLLTGV
jgi:hypothetical protein